MDIILEKIARLSELAALRRDPGALDASGVMAAIGRLEIEDESQSLPLGFLTGGAAAAAAAAIVVSVLAISGWSDFTQPMLSVDALLDFPDMIL